MVSTIKLALKFIRDCNYRVDRIDEEALLFNASWSLRGGEL